MKEFARIDRNYSPLSLGKRDMKVKKGCESSLWIKVLPLNPEQTLNQPIDRVVEDGNEDGVLAFEVPVNPWSSDSRCAADILYANLGEAPRREEFRRSAKDQAPPPLCDRRK